MLHAYFRPGRFACLAFFITAVLVFSSCAQKLSFGVSSVAPAAEGSVKIKSDKNNNYAIEVTVHNLASPGRLTPPKKEYLVWMEAEGVRTRNIGRLKTSSGLFSKKMKASLKTVTTFKPVRFFITAEDDATATIPGPVVVLQTN